MSIGEALGQARHQAGLTVAQVSQRTRVRETIIRGIEGGDYSACGGDFYARGHIRSIAQAVGADPEPLIREYDAVHREPGALPAVSLDELLTPAVTTARRRRPRWTAALVLVLGLGLVVAAGFAAYHFLAGSPHAANAVPGAGKHMVTHRPAIPATANPGPKASPGPARHPPALPVRALAPATAAAAGPAGGRQPSARAPRGRRHSRNALARQLVRHRPVPEPGSGHRPVLGHRPPGDAHGRAGQARQHIRRQHPDPGRHHARTGRPAARRVGGRPGRPGPHGVHHAPARP